MSYLNKRKFFKQVNESQTVISQLKWLSQPLRWAVTIFAATDLNFGGVFRSFFFYPLRLAISCTEILAFVDWFRLLIDRLSDFVRSSRSYIWTQAQIASECFVDALL